MRTFVRCVHELRRGGDDLCLDEEDEGIHAHTVQEVHGVAVVEHVEEVASASVTGDRLVNILSGVEGVERVEFELCRCS